MGFRELHFGQSPLVLPNAWDFASGAAFVQAGFSAVGTTSLGVAAGAGKADGQGRTREETLGLARSLARLPVPVTVDIEGGFSERPEEVAGLAVELETYGIAGINLEDSRPGGTLAPPAHHVALIKAVKAAAPALFVNARTDTHWLPGNSDQTLDRVRAYTEAGADGIFVPHIGTEEDIRAIVQATPLPVNVLFQPDGIPIGSLAALGVRRISYGSLLYRSALRAAVNVAVERGAAVGAPFSYGEVQGLIS